LEACYSVKPINGWKFAYEELKKTQNLVVFGQELYFEAEKNTDFV
jgi:hypothetical protein